MISKKRNKILWFLFYLTTIIVLLDAVLFTSGQRPTIIIELSTIYLLAVLFLYISWTTNYKKAIFFIALAFLTGLIFEIIGLNYGLFFGGHYVYLNPLLGFKLLDVPISVPVFWAIFIYTGYSVTNSFLFWLNKNKPNKQQRNILLIPVLMIIDGLLVVAMDLLMDPICVKLNNWIWVDHQQYFGVPLRNFFGWFIVTLIVTGIFRFFEYFDSSKQNRPDKSVFLMPVLVYGMFSLMFIGYAVYFEMYTLPIVGFGVMLPIVALNIILFLKHV